LRAALLQYATRFQAVVLQVKAWEKQHQQSDYEPKSVVQSATPKSEQ